MFNKSLSFSPAIFLFLFHSLSVSLSLGRALSLNLSPFHSLNLSSSLFMSSSFPQFVFNSKYKYNKIYNKIKIKKIKWNGSGNMCRTEISKYGCGVVEGFVFDTVQKQKKYSFDTNMNLIPSPFFIEFSKQTD